MAPARPVAELRASVAALATEWWLLVGGAGAYLLFALWVVGTGLAITSLAPGFADAALASVGPVTVTGLVAAAAGLWVAVPAVAVAWLLPRPLVNASGNVVYPYRDVLPGPLLAPPGVVLLALLAVTAVRGRSTWSTAAALLAGLFLLVRTAAYDRRVYRPIPYLSPVCLAAAGAALAGAWLVHAPIVADAAGPLAAPLSAAGVPTVAAAIVTAAGGGADRTLALLAAGPAVASAVYVCCQVVASASVWWRAPYPEGTFAGGTGGRRLPPTDGERTPASGGRSGRGGGPQTDDGGDPVDDIPEEFAPDTELFRRSEVGPVDRDDPDRIAAVSGPEPDSGPTFSGAGTRDTTDGCPDCGAALPSSDATAFCPECGEPLS